MPRTRKVSKNFGTALLLCQNQDVHGEIKQGTKYACACAFLPAREGDEMNIEQLREMKKQMAVRGNWKEVKRINKMIEFHGF